jgi:hypothetical protein
MKEGTPRGNCLFKNSPAELAEAAPLDGQNQRRPGDRNDGFLTSNITT